MLRREMVSCIVREYCFWHVPSYRSSDRRGPLIILSRIGFLIGFLVWMVLLIRDVLPNLLPYQVPLLSALDIIIADLAVAPRLVGIWAIIIGCIRMIAKTPDITVPPSFRRGLSPRKRGAAILRGKRSASPTTTDLPDRALCGDQVFSWCGPLWR
jgi:hypothetical protein